MDTIQESCSVVILYGTGDAVVKGGRYDHLIEKFGKKSPSIGFAIVIDELVSALTRQKIRIVYPRKNTIIVYAEGRQLEAIRLAKDFRRKAKNAELLKKDENSGLEDYIRYGNDYYAGSLVYIEETGEVTMVNLVTGEQKIVNSTDRELDIMRYLTFALGKGRLAKQTLELFEKIGITCEEMKDKDSRKLIFTNEELKLRFFLAKGPDVPTYVEYGAADIGVVGKDTILEEGRKVHEVLDLGYGKCKMCVCGYKDAAPLLQHHELIRVATKYPNIAKDYFYNTKHQTVEIIKLNGSIELAPIVGLSGSDCGYCRDRVNPP